MASRLYTCLLIGKHVYQPSYTSISRYIKWFMCNKIPSFSNIYICFQYNHFPREFTI